MLTSIISAIGNNNSIYPLLIRDCGIENPTKVVMTYNQNKSDKYIAKNAVRERIIDEYATSAVWLGGIPLVEKLCGKFIKKQGFNPNIDNELLKNNPLQNIDTNIKTFKDKAPEAVRDLIKINKNKIKYQKLAGIKFLASIAIPTIVMGFILPKLNFGLTKKIMKNPVKINKYSSPYVSMEDFDRKISARNTSKKDISFGSDLFLNMTNLSTVQKMAITDGGLSIGRVTTARNKNEAIDNGIKMTGMMYLNYIAPKQISKGLDALTKKLFKLNVKLDPMILSDKDFIEAVKQKTIQLPKDNSAKNILNFIDNNPESVFNKAAQKVKLVKMFNKTTRDPRYFVDTKEVGNLAKNINEFSQMAYKSKDIDKFIKRAQGVKCFNIMANIIISSTLLAFCLPKVQFFLRQLITKNKYEPGLTQKN